MTKKWMDVKGEIERRYLVQRIPLEEVRQQMLKEHGFVASSVTRFRNHVTFEHHMT